MTRITLIALAASFILYCGVAVTQRDANPDAGAQDAGRACDCPPVPVCQNCTRRVIHSGVFGDDHSRIVLGNVVGFNPNSSDSFLSVTTWVLLSDRVTGVEEWNVIGADVRVTLDGTAIIQPSFPELLGRPYRVIFTWTSPNPGL